MPKQLNVSLAVTADTGQAKAQLQDLQKQLTNLTSGMNSKNIGKTITEDMHKAAAAAADLKVKLEQATNPNTGRLDLTKFNESMKAGNMSIEKYKQQLTALGPEGNKAFASLAKSIMQSEVPLKRTNALLQEFKTTMANTVRWQLSSSMLHGLMSTMQSAYSYAQNLNESLNNIRIVTGQSSEQMARFAENANTAAKNLSTTTTAYTDAALIFYQQGLSDKAVKERTEATIKMSQATGDNVKDVSSYMTAIWNNFDNGSTSMEHFADVITALGASTASSSSEIASGLQQFAAIGQTVGLSYDYATASLATLVSNTRQSADSIGNSLKTLFSRLEGLKLGETLDDGVDLNKYSKALQAIGVNIIDAKGEMMQMDDILDATADKWDGLSQAQKMAFAQTVAGVRQYTTLIALMDNWDDMQQNLQTARESDGTLQKQADIYAESWEAAGKRVRAAAEDIYKTLLNDDAFITMLNGIEKILEMVNNVITAMGGLRGVVFALGAVMTKTFGKEMAQTISDIGFGLKNIGKSPQAKEDAMKTKMDTAKQMQSMGMGDASYSGEAMSKTYAAQGRMQEALVANAEKLNEADARRLSIMSDQVAKMGELLMAEGQLLEKEQAANAARVNETRRSAIGATGRNAYNAAIDQAKVLGETSSTASDLASLMGNASKDKSILVNKDEVSSRIANTTKELRTEIEQATTAGLTEAVDRYQKIVDKLEAAAQALKNMHTDADGNLKNPTTKNGREVAKALEEADDAINDAHEQLLDDVDNMDVEGETGDAQRRNRSQVRGAIDSQFQTSKRAEGFNTGIKNMERGAEQVVEGAEQGSLPIQDLGTKITAVGQAAMATAMAINTLKGAFDTFKGMADGTISPLEGIVSIISSVGMSAMMVIPAIQSLGVAFLGAEAQGASLGVVLEGLWAKMLPALPYIAAIAGIVAVLYAVHQAVTANARAAKEAAESARAASEAYDETKKSFDGLKSSIENYQSARNAIDDMAAGTEEWNNAIQDCNDQVMDLISKYPELANEVKNVNGQMKLSDEALNKVLQKGQDSVNLARIAKDQANAENYAAQQRLQGSKLKGTEYIQKDGIRYSDGSTDDTIRKISKSQAQDIATAMSTNGNNISAALEQVLNLGRDEIASVMNDTEFVSAVTDLANVIRENTAVQELAKNQEAQNVIQDTKAWQNSDYKDALNAAVSRKADANTGKIQQDAMNNATMSGAFDESLYKQQLRAYVDDYAASSGQKITAEKGGKYTLGEGDTATTFESLEALALAIERLQGLDDAAGNIDEIANSVNELAKEGLEGLLTGSADNVSDAIAENLTINNETIKKAIEEGLITEEDVSNLKTQYESYNKQIRDSMSKTVKSAFDDLGLDNNVTASAKSAIANAMQQAFNENGSEGLEKITSMFSKMDGEEANKFADAIKNIDWDTTSPTQLAQVLETAGVKTNFTTAQLLAFIEAMGGAGSTLSSLTGRYKAQNDIIGKLSDGAEISADDYAKLDAEYQQYFAMQKDGSYKLLENAEKIKDVFNDAYDEKFTQGLDKKNQENQKLQNIKDSGNVDDLKGRVGTISQDYDTGTGTVNTNFSMGDDDISKAQMQIDILKTLGDQALISTEDLQEMQEALTNGNFNVDNARMLAEAIENANISEEILNQALQNGTQEMQQYQTAVLLGVDSLGEMTDRMADWAALGMTVDPNAFADGLINLASQYDNTSQEIENYKRALENIAPELERANKLEEESKNLPSEAAAAKKKEAEAIREAANAKTKEAEESLVLSTRSGELAKQHNLDAKAVEQYAKELKASGKYQNANGKALAELASDQLRYDRAVTSASKNMKNWEKALKTSAKTGHLAADSAEQMGEAYGDLLDIDGSSLSADFLKNTKNLGLMKKALEGNEEAYEELQEAAGKDILAQCGIDTSQFDADKETIESELAEITGQEWDDIEVGASLNDEGFLQSLTDMVNAAGMTAQQAQDYLSSMGVDAEVIEEPVTTEETVATSLEATPGTVSQEYIVPSGTDGTGTTTMTATFPTVSYSAEPVPGEKETVGTALRVTSASKSSGGNVKHSGSNAANGGGGGRGGRRRGGGGGGRSARRNAVQQQEASAERYHVVKNQAEDLTKNYDRISKAKDRAYGKSRIKFIEEEIKAQDKLIDNQKEYIKEIKEYLALDTKNIKEGTITYTTENGDKTLNAGAENWLGVKLDFDENGTILNYEQLMAALDAKREEHRRYMNSKNEDDEEAKKADEEFKAIDEAFQKFLDQYEETQDLYGEETLNLLDKINERYDMFLEKVSYGVQIKIELEDDVLKYLEYALDRINDKEFAVAEKLDLINQKATSSRNNIDTYKNGITSILAGADFEPNDIIAAIEEGKDITQITNKKGISLADATSGENPLFTEDAVQQLREYVNGIIDENSNLLSYLREEFDALTQDTEEYIKHMDTSIGIVEHGQKVTQSYLNIVELVGRKHLKMGRDLLDEYNKLKVDASIEKLQAQESKLSGLNTRLASFREQEANAASEEEKALWHKQIEDLEETIRQVEEDVMDSWEDALQGVHDRFTETIQLIVEDFGAAMSGLFDNLDTLDDAYEKEKDINDEYVADYEKIYQLTKLTRDINKSIDDTSSIRGKQKLLELQKEIHELQESDQQLSEYDIDYLQKRYNLKVAEIALEDAKNAKSQVTLTRDSEGNYGYVYGSDAEDVAKAEQDYEDKIYEMQKANDEYIRELQDNIEGLNQKMLDELSNLNAADFESAEAYMAECQRITDYYSEKMNYFGSEMNKVMDNNKILYTEDWVAYSERTGYKISADENYVDSFNETVLSKLTGYQTMEDMQTNFNKLVYGEGNGEELDPESLLGQLDTAYRTWEGDVNDVMTAAGTSTEDYGEQMHEVLLGDEKSVKKDMEEATANAETMTIKVTENLSKITEAMGNMQEQWATYVGNMCTQNIALADSFRMLMGEWTKFEDKNSSGDFEDDSNDSSGGTSDGDDPNAVDTAADGEQIGSGELTWDRVLAAYKKINGGKWRHGVKNRIEDGAKEGYTKEEVLAGQQLINYVYKKKNGGKGYSMEKAKKLMGFDVGGYTGEWGSDGRLALLHEKEIVLNKEDTKNFLASIGMVREIAQMIDLNAAMAGGSFSSGLAARFAGLVGSDESLQQEVHITAEFPNATNKNEILEAFDNVINLASQYANRK